MNKQGLDSGRGHSSTGMGWRLICVLLGASPALACESFSPLESKAHGEGIVRAIAGNPATLTVETHKIGGAPCDTGGIEVAVEMEGPDLQSVTVVDNGDGTYDVTYTATQAGIYELNVTANTRHVSGSPFKVHVAPGPPSADMSVVMGPYVGARQTSTVPAGSIIRFDMHARDQYGNDLTYGCEGWFSIYAAADQPSTIADAKVVNKNNGSFTSLVVPHDTGVYNISITLNGQHVGASPYTITAGGAAPVVSINAPPPPVNPRNDLQIWAQVHSSTATGVETYQWKQLAGDLDMTSIDTNTSCLHIPEQSFSGGTTYRFELTATDAHGQGSAGIQFTTLEQAAPGCDWAELGDGVCNGACNNAACGGDYGDCGSEFPCPEGADCGEAAAESAPCGYYGSACEDYQTCVNGKCVLLCDDNSFQPEPCSEITFTGVFVQKEDGLAGLLPPGIGIGSPFHATVRIDPSAVDVDPAAVVGSYPGAVKELSVVVGGEIITAAESSGNVVVNLSQGYFAVQGQGGSGAGLNVGQISMGVLSSAFVNDSLARPYPLVTGDFDFGQIGLCFNLGAIGDACLGGYVNAVSFGECYKQIDTEGQLIIVPEVDLDENESVSGSGTINGRIRTKPGSRISANGGDLTLGDATSAGGVEIDGRVDVDDSTLTLLDADEVPLNGEATLAGGTVQTTGGLKLGPCGQVQGHGTISGKTIDTDDTSEIEATTGTLTFSGTDGIHVKGHLKTNDKKIKFTGNKKVEAGGTTKLGKGDKKGDIESDKDFEITSSGKVKGKGKIKTPKLDNHGSIEPGDSIGRLEVDGDFESDGSIEMELGGTDPDDEHDQLSVTGNCRLGGTLDVRLSGSFQPTSGDSFALIECGTTEGSFDEVILPELPDGKCWDDSELSSEGRIKVSDDCR